MIEDKEAQRDDRLTPQEQCAVLGHCMRNPRWFKLISAEVQSTYFSDLICGSLFTYISKIYETEKNPINESMIRAEIDKSQSGDAAARYKQYATESFKWSVEFRTGTLELALRKQRSHYEFKAASIEMSKQFTGGDMERITQAVEKVHEILSKPVQAQPTAEDNLVVLAASERRWREALKNRVPLITPELNKKFMLTPGITMVGGLPKSGKSTFVANLIPGILNSYPNKRILIISIEDGLDLVASRIACVMYNVNLRHYRFEPERLTPEIVATIDEMKRWLVSKLVIISAESGYETNQMEVVQEILEQAKNEDYSAIILDYYQIVNSSKKSRNKGYVDVLKEFGSWLREWSADLTIPMIMFAQLTPRQKNADLPLSQLTQSDKQISNHVHVGLEIVQASDDLGPTTEVYCHFSRWHDLVSQTLPLVRFRYIDGRLKFMLPPTT